MTIYLYVKTHNITGLKYLGMTRREDYHAYPGSGKHWIRHLQKHGYDYTTEIVYQTDSMDDFKVFALSYSIQHNIIESSNWANLMFEQGDGGDTSKSPRYIESIKNRNIGGSNNGMHGRSAIAEKNLKWYHNGEKSIYAPEGCQPDGFVPGRLIKSRRAPTEETKKKISEGVKRHNQRIKS